MLSTIVVKPYASVSSVSIASSESVSIDGSNFCPVKPSSEPRMPARSLGVGGEFVARCSKIKTPGFVFDYAEVSATLRKNGCPHYQFNHMVSHLRAFFRPPAA